MLNWVQEITGTLHPLCKPQHFRLLGARGATRQIIRAGGNTRPQHWGKRLISGERKNYEGGSQSGSMEVVGVRACWFVCVEVGESGFTQNVSSRVILYSCIDSD